MDILDEVINLINRFRILDTTHRVVAFLVLKSVRHRWTGVGFEV